MADKKSSGFKTFLLMLIVVVLAFFLGCGAYLILTPNSSIFGVSYSSYRKTDTTISVAGNPLRFSNYTKIVVDTSSENKGYTDIEINYDNADTSSIKLIKNSSGFLKGEVRQDYELAIVPNGQTLNITLLEPEYNFIRLNSYSILQINICSTIETISNITNTEFELKTHDGSITVGGAVSTQTSASNFYIKSLKAENTSGKIVIDPTTNVSTNLDLTSKNSGIKIYENIAASSVNISANKGDITTESFTNYGVNATIYSRTSHIKVKQINGNLILDTIGGIVEIDKVLGNFTTTTRVDDSYIYINEVDGNVAVSSEKKDLTLKIGKVGGDANILAGTRTIKIGDALGSIYITTTSGQINVSKNASNAESMNLTSKSGTIFAYINNVRNENNLTSSSGNMTIVFRETTPFILNATSTKGKVEQKYSNDKTNPIVNAPRGGLNPDSANKITAISTSGNITFGWFE